MARTPAVEATTPASRLDAKRVATTGKRERVKSLSEVATLLDVSRNTVAKWIDDGMPVEVRSMSKGVPHKIDVAEAVRWLKREARAEGTARSGEPPAGAAGFPPPDGGEDKEMALTRKARADADRAESEAAIKAMDEDERRGASDPYGIFTDMVRAEYTVTINRRAGGPGGASTAIGTITWAAGATQGTFNIAAGVVVPAGDVIEFVFPSTQDSNAAVLALNLAVY